jgi:hypothetical protein
MHAWRAPIHKPLGASINFMLSTACSPANSYAIVQRLAASSFRFIDAFDPIRAHNKIKKKESREKF